MNLFTEMTDPETIMESPEANVFIQDLVRRKKERKEKKEKGNKKKIQQKTQLDNQISEHLVQNLFRFKESDEEDSKAIYNTLNLIENLAEIKPKDFCELSASSTRILDWLLQRLKKPAFDANKLYCSEILAVYLHSSELVRNMMRDQNLLAKSKGSGKSAEEAKPGEPRMDDLLEAIALYRKNEPESSEESELLENLFDCVCYSMMVTENQDSFRKLEGIELCLIIIK